MYTHFENLLGHVFGRLTVISFAGSHPKLGRMWECRCVCGKYLKVPRQSLNGKNTRSCGCMHSFVKTHGRTMNGKASPEYTAFINAKARCTVENHQSWKNYGGRGIKFLFTDFKQWILELGLRPSAKHSVDRKDNNGNYEPGNMQWSTKKEQQNNRRICDVKFRRSRAKNIEK